MLDGNARLNLATFVTTWMEPQAEQLMAECLDKNMIDKDEYPQTAELEMRCVNILSRLWHAPDADAGDRAARRPARARRRCSAASRSSGAGSSGAAAAGKPADKPNIVMGINVQVCWEKFANYWDVEMRLVPMEGNRFTLSAEEAVKLCDENTIGVVAILGSTFDGSYEPVAEICAALDDLQERTGLDVPVHVDGASGAFVAPFIDPDLEWDFRLPRVASINTSGHKYGLVYPGVGWIVWRDAAALPEDLIFWVNYLGDNMPTFALNFSRPGAQVVAQYYNFLRLGFEGYRKVQAYARDVAMRLSARDRRARAVRAAHAGRRAAGVRLQGARTGSTTSRSSTSRRAARARLAGARLHVPGEPRGPGGAARRRAARLQPRHRPTCSSTTSSGSCRACRTSRSRCTAPPVELPPLTMCRLFGLSAAPHRVHASFWLLEAPDSMGAQSRRNPDGTGLGVFGADGRRCSTSSRSPPTRTRVRARGAPARRRSSPTSGYASTGGLTSEHAPVRDGRAAHGPQRRDSELRRSRPSSAARGGPRRHRLRAHVRAGHARIERNGGDVGAGILAAAAGSPRDPRVRDQPDPGHARELWALRYPETHGLYVLKRAAGGIHGDRPLHGQARPCASLRAPGAPPERDRGQRAAGRAPGLAAARVGELVHVGRRPQVTSRGRLAHPPANQMQVSYLHPPSAQH